MQKYAILSYLVILAVSGTLYSQGQMSKEKSATRSFHPAPVLSERQKQEVRAIMREVAERWSDRYGCLRLTPCSDKNEPLDNENPVLFTSECFYLLWRLGMLQGDLKASYRSKVAELITALRLKHGLVQRRPVREKNAFRQLSIDEQVGLVTLDLVFDWQLGVARELLAYGEQHGYRQSQPPFIEYMRLANGQNASPLGQRFFRQALHMTLAGPREETRDKILTYLWTEVFRGRDSESDRVIDEFLHKMRLVYGDNALYEIMCIYFSHKDHPCRRLAKLLTTGRALPPMLAEIAQNPFDGVPQSWLTTAVELDLGKLTTVLNQDLEQEVFTKSGATLPDTGQYLNVTYRLVICRNGDIRIQVADDVVKVSVPLKFAIRVECEEKVTRKIVKEILAPLKGLGKNIRKAIENIEKTRVKQHFDANGELTVQMSSKIGIQEDGQLAADTGLTFHWDEEPVVEIGPAKISISTVTGPELQAQLNKLADRLEAQVQKIRLHDLAAKYWRALQQPILLSAKPRTWLLCQPHSLHISTPRLADNKLKLSLALQSQLRLHLGEKPAVMPATNLADVKLVIGDFTQQAKRQCHLAVPVALDYSELRRQVVAALTRNPLRWQQFEATIDEVELYGAEDLLVVALRFTAKGGSMVGEQGWMFVAGSLKCDGKTQPVLDKLEFHPLFSSEGANFLASMIMPMLQNEITDYLHTATHNEIGRIQPMLNIALARVPVGNVAWLTGSVQTFNVGTMQVGHDALQLTLMASGNLQLQIRPEFIKQFLPKD